MNVQSLHHVVLVQVLIHLHLAAKESIMTVSSCLRPQNQLALNHLQILPQDSFDLKLNNLSHYSPCFFRKLLLFRLRYAVTLHLWVCGVLLLRQLLVIDAQFRIIQQVLFLFVVAFRLIFAYVREQSFFLVYFFLARVMSLTFQDLVRHHLHGATMCQLTL